MHMSIQERIGLKKHGGHDNTIALIDEKVIGIGSTLKYVQSSECGEYTVFKIVKVENGWDFVVMRYTDMFSHNGSLSLSRIFNLVKENEHNNLSKNATSYESVAEWAKKYGGIDKIINKQFSQGAFVITYN